MTPGAYSCEPAALDSVRRSYHPACILAARDHDHMGVCMGCWALGQADAGRSDDGPAIIAAIAAAETGTG
jgi:hypothetical protein